MFLIVCCLFGIKKKYRAKLQKKLQISIKKALKLFEFQGLCYFVRANDYFLLRLALFW